MALTTASEMDVALTRNRLFAANQASNQKQGFGFATRNQKLFELITVSNHKRSSGRFVNTFAFNLAGTIKIKPALPITSPAYSRTVLHYVSNGIMRHGSAFIASRKQQSVLRVAFQRIVLLRKLKS
ncbi:MAG: hypothetical protein PUE49_07170, partial [Eggerthellales bacterium]|nr:hypothetical protein [Eggerthellales bacterium]